MASKQEEKRYLDSLSATVSAGNAVGYNDEPLLVILQNHTNNLYSLAHTQRTGLWDVFRAESRASELAITPGTPQDDINDSKKDVGDAKKAKTHSMAKHLKNNNYLRNNVDSPAVKEFLLTMERLTLILQQIDEIVDIQRNAAHKLIENELKPSYQQYSSAEANLNTEVGNYRGDATSYNAGLAHYEAVLKTYIPNVVALGKDNTKFETDVKTYKRSVSDYQANLADYRNAEANYNRDFAVALSRYDLADKTDPAAIAVTNADIDKLNLDRDGLEVMLATLKVDQKNIKLESDRLVVEEVDLSNRFALLSDEHKDVSDTYDAIRSAKLQLDGKHKALSENISTLQVSYSELVTQREAKYVSAEANLKPMIDNSHVYAELDKALALADYSRETLSKALRAQGNLSPDEKLALKDHYERVMEFGVDVLPILENGVDAIAHDRIRKRFVEPAQHRVRAPEALLKSDSRMEVPEIYANVNKASLILPEGNTFDRTQLLVAENAAQSQSVQATLGKHVGSMAVGVTKGQWGQGYKRSLIPEISYTGSTAPISAPTMPLSQKLTSIGAVEADPKVIAAKFGEPARSPLSPVPDIPLEGPLQQRPTHVAVQIPTTPLPKPIPLPAAPPAVGR
jgi:hypothetical protein